MKDFLTALLFVFVLCIFMSGCTDPLSPSVPAPHMEARPSAAPSIVVPR